MLYRLVLSLSKVKWFSILSLFVIAVLILSACQPVLPMEAPAAPTTTAPVPHTPRFDAPPYGVRGPYAVGVQDFMIEPTEEGERPIPASVWYPALNPDGQAESATYMLNFGNPNFPDFAIGGRALRDAQPDASGGPYPLVVYSHGLTLFRQISSYLAEHLASWGFVVIAGDHEDNWSGLAAGVPHNFVVRPKEITRQIDFAETLGASGGELANLIDMEHVGVTGHSFGAETALLMGGAQLNTNMFLNEWCATNPVDALNDCGAVATLLDQMVEKAGLETVPESLWPDWSDPRVDAVVPLALGPQHFGPEGFATVQVPVLLVESELDWYAGAANATYAPYSLLPAGRNTHLVFERADHALFLNSCDAMPALPGQGLGSFCTDPVWDMDRAHDLINHFVTAFFAAELKGDADAAAALAPENVALPGIQYESTGYGAAAAPESLLDDAAVAKIEGIIQKAITDYPAPGFEMCIVKDGQVAYSKGFGLADVAENRAVTPQSLQIQASVSKPLVAMAVMQLAEQGLIDLDAPVTDYLPYFTMADERYEAITVRMLMGHRSGMADTPASWTEPLDPAVNPLEQAVRGLSEAELLFAPDEAWSYSGYGYITLGAILAAVTGQPFESYMAEQWLAPMGMTNSTFIADDVDPALRMTAHKSDVDGKATPTEIACDGRNGSACNLWSNCEDMVKWAQLMLNKGEIDGARFLQPESIDAMWMPVSETGWLEMMGPWYGSPIANYGLGWMLGETEGHRLVGHAGGVEGANSQILLAPDDGLAVITMDNWLDLAAIPAYPASNAATDVMYILLGIEPQ
jgi:CubicO group peptidase (beta-lactamase class C family)/predicted dienelactone hydrolase